MQFRQEFRAAEKGFGNLLSKDNRESLGTRWYVQGIENGKNKFRFKFNATAILVHTTHVHDLMALPA